MTLTEILLLSPFALLLLSMALLPVVAPAWWGCHYPKVAVGLALMVAGYYAGVRRDFHGLTHAVQEYLGFMALVGSLFVVGGGIQLGLPGRSSPGRNVGFLFVGAILANLLGTTGAAMVLIRPWLRFNQHRLAPHHVIFFIFLVANVGGGLTPIGDPPLFLGFLEGIPFWWVLQHCWQPWLLMVGAILSGFYWVDWGHARRHSNSSLGAVPATGGWVCIGWANLFFLGLIIGSVFLPAGWRELVMVLAAIGSYFTTPKAVHAANDFNFHPALEVGILFVGIFVTMIPALEWLQTHARQLLGHEPGPGTFFWGTGLLSAGLDNAPTYLGFWQCLRGVSGLADTQTLLSTQTVHVAAISVGAVFFGAATYIGNGPNFMIKAIAERAGVRMPSFAAYVWKYALPGLLPGLLLVWWWFFRD